jgi:phosphoribosylformylglycinamidine synthase
MTECVYVSPLLSFKSDRVPDEVEFIPVLEGGRKLLEELNETMGLAFDDRVRASQGHFSVIKRSGNVQS